MAIKRLVILIFMVIGFQNFCALAQKRLGSNSFSVFKLGIEQSGNSEFNNWLASYNVSAKARINYSFGGLLFFDLGKYLTGIEFAGSGSASPKLLSGNISFILGRCYDFKNWSVILATGVGINGTGVGFDDVVPQVLQSYSSQKKLMSQFMMPITPRILFKKDLERGSKVAIEFGLKNYQFVSKWKYGTVSVSEPPQQSANHFFVSIMYGW